MSQLAIVSFNVFSEEAANDWQDHKFSTVFTDLEKLYMQYLGVSLAVCSGAGEIEIALGDKTCFDVRGNLQGVQCSWLLKVCNIYKASRNELFLHTPGSKYKKNVIIITRQKMPKKG